MSANTPLADRLLDAQVAHFLAELEGDRLHAVIAREVNEVLDVLAGAPLEAIVGPDDVTRILTRLLATVPASVAASTLVQAAADVAHDGPSAPITLDDMVTREQVEAIVDQVLGLHPVLDQALDSLTDSPMVGTVAARFISRIVVDVLQANRSVAEKIPGVGSIMSLGSSAASMVIGAADKPLQMVGDTTGKGAAFALRRLNKVVIQTIQDPMMRDAILEVWDTYASRPIDGLADQLSQDAVREAAGSAQDVVITAAASPAIKALIETYVAAFFAIYGEHPLTTLLEELDVSQDDVVADIQLVVPRVVDAWRVDGRLEQAIRGRLAPFFGSPQVQAMLAETRSGISPQ